MTNTRIYLTDLQAYNEGALVGKWITLPCENIHDELKEILKEGEIVAGSANHEEYFITDSESPFEINEYSSLDKINELAELFEDLDETEIKKIKFLEWQGETTEQALEHIEDVEIYENMDLKEVAESFVDEGYYGEINESIINYIDFDSIARDLSYDGYNEIENDVFRMCY